MVVMVVEGDLGAIEVTHSPGGGDHQGQANHHHRPKLFPSENNHAHNSTFETIQTTRHSWGFGKLPEPLRSI